MCCPVRGTSSHLGSPTSAALPYGPAITQTRGPAARSRRTPDARDTTGIYKQSNDTDYPVLHLLFHAYLYMFLLVSEFHVYAHSFTRHNVL